MTIDRGATISDPDGDLDPTSANTTCARIPRLFRPGQRVLVNNGDGTFDYTPNPNFNGNDSFVYEICDTSSLCDTATVSITVAAVADPPLAVDDSASTPEDRTVTIDVADNDSDPDGNLDPSSANISCATCSNPANGILANNGDGTFDLHRPT